MFCFLLFTLVASIFAHTGIANGKSHKGFARLQHWRTSLNTIGRRFKLMHKPQRLRWCFFYVLPGQRRERLQMRVACIIKNAMYATVISLVYAYE
jgi:hypothetical protein